MYWKAKLKDGTTKCHAATDLHGPAASHHDLDPAQVERFDLIEGNQSVWGMDGMPRNLRKRPSIVAGKRGIEVYVIVLPTGIVIAKANGVHVKLPDFLPYCFRCDGKTVEWLAHDAVTPMPLSPVYGAPVVTGDTITLAGGIVLNTRGDVTIDGKIYPELYPWCAPFDRHHEKETPASMRPDPPKLTHDLQESPPK